jgi:7,8-dihydroneopterin aldolase/epimerase/oxygenase
MGVSTMGDEGCMQIVIDKLNVAASVGIHQHERGAPQAVLMDAVLQYRTPGRWPEYFVDYERMCSDIATFLIMRPHTELLESLAVDVTTWLLDRYPSLYHVEVALQKPRARRNFATFSVKYQRSR